MRSFLKIIEFNYLQRTRSYAFLITLCATLAIAYTFVPEPNANYSTIRIADYVGVYNSAWFGYVTAIMTSVFLSLIGFYLINSSVKNDIDTKVGHIIASTSISNFRYLMAKVMSNFMLLLTIVAVVFLMSILLFIFYNDGYSFEIHQFIKPYLLITIPAMFIIALLAVIFEVFLGRYSVLQNMGFFFLCCSLMVFSPKTATEFSLDIFGSKVVMHHLEETVKEITNSDKETDLSIGYVLGNTTKAKKFEFTGIDFPWIFIASRFIWMLLGVLFIALISKFFHRFDIKRKIKKKFIFTSEEKKNIINEINLTELIATNVNYSIFPLLKIEFLMLFRKGKKWLWILNSIGMILLAVLETKFAHQLVLPILWFLQVHRISDITSQEITTKTYLFSFSSYKPIGRILVSKILSSLFLLGFVAAPLIIKLGIDNKFDTILQILLGLLFLVLMASTFGLLSKGKKLFEVVFFLITYGNINGIVFLDYFGGFQHQSNYLTKLVILICVLISFVFLLRKHQLKSL